jgi:putative ABC transport system permease protein
MVLAFPLSWWLVSSWLQDFAYRIDLSAIPFILSGVITLIASVSVVSLRCLKAANTNPVKALKYE